MALEGVYSRPRGSVRDELTYRLRIIHVFARTEFKLKYAESVLGYFWSLAKPLIYFAVLWIVFGQLFKTTVPDFGLYLIVGVVLFTYLSDSVSTALPSIVSRGAVLRRVSFPSISVPLGSLASSTMTFGLNLLAVAVFIAIADVRPHLDWLLILPLLLELLAFVAGVALVASSLFVRFRDVGQIWDVLATVILYTSAIMYPISILPVWAQRVFGLNPLVQITQDIRRLLLADEPGALAQIPVLHSQIFPILIALSLLVAGIVLHKREAARFPEIA